MGDCHTQHTVEESSLHGEKFFAAGFGILLGLYYLSSLATAVLLWPTDGRVSVDTHVAWPRCMCIAPGYRCNFLH